MARRTKEDAAATRELLLDAAEREFCERGASRTSLAEVAPIAQRRQAERSLCLAHVERLLQQAIDAGQLPRDTDTSLATHALHAFMSGLMREWVLEKNAYDLAAVAPALVEMTVAGLR